MINKRIQKSFFSLCVPITPATPWELAEHLKSVGSQQPDFIEWRRDYLGETSPEEEKAILSTLSDLDIPVIYTYRKGDEGGFTNMAEEYRLERIRIAMGSSGVAYVDVELNNSAFFLENILNERKKTSCGVILSAHSFHRCYNDYELEEKIKAMLEHQPDVIKIAHTPLSTLEAKKASRLIKAYNDQIKTPIIHVMMGEYGKSSRAFPEASGGSLTYAVGVQSTAPGQLSAEQILFLRKNEKSH